MLVDVSRIGITGKQAQEVLGEVDIVVNKNTIPFDAQPPMIGSGIRLGAPAVSTRGFGIKDMKQVGSLMAEVLKNIDKPEVKQQVRNEVNKICQRFQVPGID
jgi:glycine hydroxymethyltransferase